MNAVPRAVTGGAGILKPFPFFRLKGRASSGALNFFILESFFGEDKFCEFRKKLTLDHLLNRSLQQTYCFYTKMMLLDCIELDLLQQR